MNEKIRVLFIAATTKDVSYVRLNEEARAISESIEQGSLRHKFELAFFPAVKAGDFQRLLMRHKPHIVHFSGHGSLAEQIVREGASDEGNKLSTEPLPEIFRLLCSHVRVVVFNTSITEQQVKALTDIVDYVIGISQVIGDRAAVTFAGAFYLALGFGKPVEDAFESAKAELLLQKVPRSKGLRMFVRKGVDRKVPFPPARIEAIEENGVLAKALQDLIDNNASADVIHRVRRATLDGSLVLEQADEIIEGEAIIFETSGAKGSGKALRARVHPVTYGAVQERLFPPPLGIGPPPPGLIVVGRENSLAHLRKLLAPAKARSFELTVVRGWPGVGKTTLVGILGRDPDVLKHFPEGVLWTALGRNPELMTKMVEWGRALGTDEILNSPNVDDAVDKLGALLRHRRMLVIVDDIWKAEHAVPFLKAAAAGSSCSLLATTRLTEVAEALSQDPRRIFVLPELTEKDSLVLLSYLAPGAVEQYPDECRHLINDLGNLPLALHVAGKLLRAEAKLGLSVIDLIEGIRGSARILEESAPMDRTEETVLPAVHALLKRSTDDLNDQTRDYFAYLSAFAPNPATFDAAAMKAVWQIDDPRPIIRELVGHGLLEPTGSGRFQMHPLLVKHASSLLD